VSDSGQNWDRLNYFNYFTEVEEHFQRTRGSGLFLLSPLDWALIEAWKSSGVPLEAVLRGIDTAFEKWRSKRSRIQAVNSLAYCAQAVLAEAQRMAENSPAAQRTSQEAESFCSLAELSAFLTGNAAKIRACGAAFDETALALEHLVAELERHFADIEALEQRLSVLEEKMLAMARTQQSADDLLAARQELERHLRPYRGKMTTDQLKMLQSQFLDRQLLEKLGLPRLSLFYLR
jgi:hypothetical protein